MEHSRASRSQIEGQVHSFLESPLEYSQDIVPINKHSP